MSLTHENNVPTICLFLLPLSNVPIISSIFSQSHIVPIISEMFLSSFLITNVLDNVPPIGLLTVPQIPPLFFHISTTPTTHPILLPSVRQFHSLSGVLTIFLMFFDFRQSAAVETNVRRKFVDQPRREIWHKIHPLSP